MDFSLLTRRHYFRSVGWTVFVCLFIVSIAALLARATLNLSAALVSKPDLAIYILRPDIEQATLLRSDDLHRQYLAETEDGMELIDLVKQNRQWRIKASENLHE